MNKINLFTLLLLGSTFLLACSNEKDTKVAESWHNYGPQKVHIDSAISVADLESLMEHYKSAEKITLQGELEEVCAKAGCWISLKKSDGSHMRVIFKDHFTIPTDTPLKTEVFLIGSAYWDTIPVEMLRHYEEDAGKSAEEIAKITTDKVELNFVADGIRFKSK